jgi:Bax protein
MKFLKKFAGLPNFLIAYIFFFLISCAGKSDHSKIETARPLPQGHIDFIKTIYPAIHSENQQISDKREQIIKLRKRFKPVIKSGKDFEWLIEVATRYKFDEDYFHEELSRTEYRHRIDSLLMHVDIVPDKLVMAQAAIESGWGQSRFAREGNSFFGLRCFRPGCGIAASDVENPNFWVKSYPNVKACVKEYIWNLNVGHAYDDLRLIRYQLRNEGKIPDAHDMATALERYSEIGNDYIKLIISVINNWLPEDLEAFVLHHSKEIASSE